MHFSIKNIAKASAVYSVGQWATVFLGVFLIPVYTRIFSTADYGVIDLIAATAAFLVLGLQLGMDEAIGRFFLDTGSEEEKARIATTTLLFKLLTYIPVLAAGILLSGWISRLLFRSDAYAGLIAWSLATVFTTALFSLFLNLLRLRFKAHLFVAVSFLQFVSQLLLTIYFIVYAGTGIVGIYWASILSMGFFAIILFFLNRTYLRARWDTPLLKAMFVFGIPTVPSAIAYYLMQYLDRFFIAHYRDLGELGLYAIAYKVCMVLLIVTAGFNMAWGPFVYSSFRKHGAREIIARTLSYYNSIMTFIAVAIAIFSPELLRVFTTPEYYGGARVVGLVVFGILVFQVTDYFCVGIGIAKKMHIRMWSGLAAVVANCLLNWLLIPRYGMVGAAWATLISYALYGTIVMAGSEISFHIPYAYFPNLALWLIGGGMVVLERFWLGPLPLSPGVICAKAVLLAVFILSIFTLKLIPSYIVRGALDTVTKRRRRDR